jgi:hypothetical protein
MGEGVNQRYEEWRQQAQETAERSGAAVWRREPESRVYDAALLAEHTEELTRMREARKAMELIPLLREALYRHLGELADPRLYAATPLGTKHLVEAFYEEALACIAYLADPALTGLDPLFTLAGFKRAAHIFGRSALLLSGGASLGFFHLGVVKALSENSLLPDVLSGASMGALIACGVGVRTEPSSVCPPSGPPPSAPCTILGASKRSCSTTTVTSLSKRPTSEPAAPSASASRRHGSVKSLACSATTRPPTS